MKATGEVKVFIGIATVALALVGMTVYATRQTSGPEVPDRPNDYWPELRTIAVGKDVPILGDPNAQYTLVEYGDYQCPSCRRAEPVVEGLIKKYASKMNYVFRHVTIRPDHYHAPMLSKAVAAANAQGKFWEMHRSVFTTKIPWDSMDPDGVKKRVKSIAGGLGLDMMQFTAFLQGDAGAKWLAHEDDKGRQARIQFTPTFYLLKPKGYYGVFGDLNKLIARLQSEDTWK